MLRKLCFAIVSALFLASLPCLGQVTLPVPSTLYPTIQSAVDAAHTGDTVLVAPGTYAENVSITSKEITLTSSSGSSVTTIDGASLGSVVSITSTPSLKTTINGFTLINGRSGSSGSTAGVFLTNAGATITNNVLSSNAAAVSVTNGSITLSRNTISTITGGSVCTSGNGVRLFGDSTVVDGTGKQIATRITNNVISAVGKCAGGVGIIGQQGSDLTIAYNQISGQTLGINTFPNSAITYIHDNLIQGNTTGGLYIQHQVVTPAADPADYLVVNNTFANNLSAAKALSGTVGPAELYVSGSYSKVAVINNIFSTSSSTNPILDCAGAVPSVTNPVTPMIVDHNLFWNPTGKIGIDACPVTIGTFGNINVAPQFTSTTDFHPQSSSPVIDAGNNSALTALYSAVDLDANTRVFSFTTPLFPVIDMGAYEATGLSGSVGGTPNISGLGVTSSSYYLLSGNTFTLTARLDNSTAVAITHVAGASVTVTQGGGGGCTFTATTDGTGSISSPCTIATPGSYSFVATFSGGGTVAPATSTVIYVFVTSPLAVTSITANSTPNPSLIGQQVTFTVTSNSTDGTHPTPVILSDNGVALATLPIPSNGSTTFKTTTLALGTHPITATYAGDSAHTSGAATPYNQVVGNFTATTTTLSATPNPSIVTQAVTLSVHITSGSGVPTGSVQFMDGGSNVGPVATVDGSGNASYTTSAFTVGLHSLTANFTATGSFAGSAGTTTLAVNNPPTQSILTVTPGATVVAGTNVTMSAQVSVLPPYSGSPFGTVTFYDGNVTTGVALGTATLNGSSFATLTVSTLAVGTHSLTCRYNSGGTGADSVCNAVLQIVTASPTGLSITSSANPSPALTAVSFTVHMAVGGQPAGAGNVVLFTLSTLPTTVISLTTDASGQATYTTSTLAPGSYNATASFVATSTLLASISPVFPEVIVANPTSTTLIAAPNPGLQNNAETLVATVAATTGTNPPTGVVNVFDGAVLLSSAAVTPSSATISSATFRVVFSTAGLHTLTAVFVPSTPPTNFLTSTSAALALTINPQDFTFTATPPTLGIQAGHRGSLQLTLTSIGSFSSTLFVACPSVLPAYVSCAVPSSAVLNGNSPATITLDIDTSALPRFYGVATPAGTSSRMSRIAWTGLLPFALLIALRRRRRIELSRSMSIMLVVVMGAVTGGLSSCSGLQPAFTPAGTYNIPITATGTAAGSSTATTHTVNITLTVSQ